MLLAMRGVLWGSLPTPRAYTYVRVPCCHLTWPGLTYP